MTRMPRHTSKRESARQFSISGLLPRPTNAQLPLELQRVKSESPWHTRRGDEGGVFPLTPYLSPLQNTKIKMNNNG